MDVGFEPCGRCGKDHRTDRCPGVVRYPALNSSMMAVSVARGRLLGGKKYASNRRLDRAFKEMRHG